MFIFEPFSCHFRVNSCRNSFFTLIRQFTFKQLIFTPVYWYGHPGIHVLFKKILQLKYCEKHQSKTDIRPSSVHIIYKCVTFSCLANSDPGLFSTDCISDNLPDSSFRRDKDDVIKIKIWNFVTRGLNRSRVDGII